MPAVSGAGEIIEAWPGAVLAVSIDKIQPPNKSQKEEKLAILITYAFTINQVPHVFREHYFARHQHKYMEEFTERSFSTLICARNKGDAYQINATGAKHHGEAILV